MKSRRIRHLVVLDGKDVAGVVSSRDLDAMGLSPGGPQVQDVMTYPAMAVGPDATIRQAANLLRGRTDGLPASDGRGQARRDPDDDGHP